MRINGVDHEFSTISGVKEDVTDIVLNLKQVNLRYLGERDTVVRLKSSGEGVLRAGDIQTSGDVEVLNPDQHIATVGSDGKLDMELVVRHGRGYSVLKKTARKTSQKVSSVSTQCSLQYAG